MDRKSRAKTRTISTALRGGESPGSRNHEVARGDLQCPSVVRESERGAQQNKLRNFLQAVNSHLAAYT